MIVIGGGVIGLEMGSVYARLGTKVTVVEYQDKIFGAMDGEISKAMLTIFKKQGIAFSLSTKVTGGNVTASGVTVNVESVKGEKLPSLAADYVLVSTGR